MTKYQNSKSVFVKGKRYNCNKLIKLVERDKPTKVNVYDDEHYFECINCIENGDTDSAWLFVEYGEYKFCPRCGKRLDWR